MSILLQVIIGLILTALGVYTIWNEKKLIKLERKIGLYITGVVKNVVTIVNERKQTTQAVAVSGFVDDDFNEILSELNEAKAEEVNQNNITNISDYFVA